MDYSRFVILALIGQGLFWVLNHLHSLLGNWGWSIVGLVVLVKLAPVSYTHLDVYKRQVGQIITQGRMEPAITPARKGRASPQLTGGGSGL